MHPQKTYDAAALQLLRFVFDQNHNLETPPTHSPWNLTMLRHKVSEVAKEGRECTVYAAEAEKWGL